MKKKLQFCFFLAFHALCFAQIYQPLDTADFAQRKQFLMDFKNKKELFIKSQKAKLSGKTAIQFGKTYQEYYKAFEEQVKEKAFVFNSPFNDILNGILLELQKNNPQIPKNVNLLVARNNVPNAACLPDGTFVVHMGIFNWLDNEDQIAAILSHEIAHQLKEHSVKSIVNAFNHAKNDAELTHINRKLIDSNLRNKAFNIAKGRLYESKNESRKNEIQSDSLGYTLFRNTPFKKAEFLHALENLRDYDSLSPRMLQMETYQKLYDLPQQPFKNSWMKKEDFSLYNYGNFRDKLDKDSISTHPEMSVRIEILEKEFPEIKSQDSVKTGGSEFLKLQKMAKMEILPNFYQTEDFGVGIYVAMQMIQDNFEEAYVKSWIGRFFNKIYVGRKNYTLNRYLDRVDPKSQSESYQQFLNFMWNLSVEDIQKFADFYSSP